jgi:acetyl-CoA acyltransferase
MKWTKNMKNNISSHEPIIVAAARTAVGKAKRGSLVTTRPEDMMVPVIKELINRSKPLKPEDIDDVILGCAFPEGEQGMNMARQIVFAADLPVEIPAETINRFCSSGMQSIIHAIYAIMAGEIEVAIAGGVESMSMVPMAGNKFSPTPQLAENFPEAFTSMGITAENVAEKYNISREEQDAFALRSNRLASNAVDSGIFDDQIVPLNIELVEAGTNGRTEKKTFVYKRDEGPRSDTSLEALAKLRPAFKLGGTVTAGNSSQMSDGAAGVVVMSRTKAEKLELKPLARLIAHGVAGVPPDIMGIGPIKAVPKALKNAGFKLEDIELIELNEAFAAQGLAVMKELGLNEEITNVNGGAIALGHPLGATGAKLTTQLIYEMIRRNNRYGMVTMCIGGGMGAAGIFENLSYK